MKHHKRERYMAIKAVVVDNKYVSFADEYGEEYGEEMTPLEAEKLADSLRAAAKSNCGVATK